MNIIRNNLYGYNGILLLIIVAIFTTLSFSYPGFFSEMNLESITMGFIGESFIALGMLVAVYAISGLLAGLAAILISAKSGMGYAGYGVGTELTAITAAVIGGANLNGGKGSIFGACLGVIFLAMINNGFILAGINPNWQWFVNGIILIIFLCVNAFTTKKER